LAMLGSGSTPTDGRHRCRCGRRCRRRRRRGARRAAVTRNPPAPANRNRQQPHRAMPCVPRAPATDEAQHRLSCN